MLDRALFGMESLPDELGGVDAANQVPHPTVVSTDTNF